MMFSSRYALPLGHNPLIRIPFSSSSPSHSSNFIASTHSLGAKGIHSNSISIFPSVAIKSINLDCTRVSQRINQSIEIDNDDYDEVEACKNPPPPAPEVEKCIKEIKAILGRMEGGELTTSAYDTAMVALVKDINGNGNPQFPSCLEWICNNQMDDGSWGAPYIFLVSDRLINTLACVIALKSWNIHPNKILKGISFFNNNFDKLANENEEHMLIGFEIVLPGLIQRARKLEIEVPNDSHPILKEIYAKRNLKLSKIPEEIFHTEHTTLLFSTEGLEDLEMERVIKLQCPDGSMLYSPASTAHAFIHTKDLKCLTYLTQVVDKFNGRVPYIYPVDMFARNWAIDQIQRLGISRYFVAEIDELISYVSRYWDPKRGAYSISNSPFHNIDDTALCFRNLRLHGYQISPDAFWHFKYGDAFCCFPRQSSESVTAIFDLLRASQLQFPGEKVLDETKNFSYKFLREREANNTLIDKWVLLKDLPGEVKYALDMPWYANLPRVESRFYIEQYGGEEDVWIGKTLYQMKEVNNNTYLKLAKLDYNLCQEQHQLEWLHMLRWYKKNNLMEFGISERMVLLDYFLATANIFELERSNERLGWAKSSILLHIVSTYINKHLTSNQQKLSFINTFKTHTINALHKISANSNSVEERVISLVCKTLYQQSVDVFNACGRDIHLPLFHAWEIWLMTWQEEDVNHVDSHSQSSVVLLATTINMFGGRLVTDQISSHPQYHRLTQLIAKICNHLHPHHVSDDEYCLDRKKIITVEIESNMQELLQLVLQKSSDVDRINCNIKQTFLAIAKTAYYAAYCSSATINMHVHKVLFQPVI